LHRPLPEPDAESALADVPETLAPPDGRHRVSGRAGLGLALTLITVAAWSTLPIGLKIALDGMDAVTLTWVRFVAATAILGTAVAWTGHGLQLRRLDRRHALLLLVASVFLCSNYVLYAAGLALTDPGTAQVVIQLAPLLLALGAVVLYREHFGLWQRLGLAVMASGLLLFSHEQVAHLIGSLERYALGFALVVLAAIAWAVYGLAQKQLLGRMSSPAIMTCIYVVGAVALAPFAHPGRLADLTAGQLGALAFCIVNMVISYGAFAEALAHLEASRTSAVLAIVPLTTLAALAVAERFVPELVDARPLTGLAILGAAMVVAGSVATAAGRRG
jgi:drug/metabolite transporter (DMT)-like permease